MNILIWRSWKPAYDPPAVFSAVSTQSLGGTESQLLWHARNLTLLGHRVEVLGVSPTEVTEEGVRFVGAADRGGQEELMRSGRLTRPDVVFAEGELGVLDTVKERYPEASVVLVAQNLDRYSRGSENALRRFRDVDAFAFCGYGQFAEFVVRYPRLRHKFFLLPNVVPWEWLYERVPRGPVEDLLVWVGHWSKPGVREWAMTMERILEEYPGYRWILCGPRYGHRDRPNPEWALRGLRLPRDRVDVQSLPQPAFARLVSTARAVLVSLSRETACISALDAHAMGRPVLSGNTTVFKYTNPEATGLRVFTARERHAAVRLLIEQPGLADRLGELGREDVLAHFTERNQRLALRRLLVFLEARPLLGPLSEARPLTFRRECLYLFRYGLARKLAALGLRSRLATLSSALVCDRGLRAGARRDQAP